MNEVPDDPEKRPTVPLRVTLPPEFAAEAARRGVDPAVLAGRLAELYSQFYEEGPQLFEEWAAMSNQERHQFIMDAVRVRGWMEFPPLDK